jgi:hypothetical protein
MQKGVLLISKLQNIGASAAALPPRRLYYRPAVVFGHLRLPALAFPYKKKFGALLKNSISILFTYLKMACLKLRNLKLRKSLSVRTSTKTRLLRPKQSSIHCSFIILPLADTI